MQRSRLCAGVGLVMSYHVINAFPFVELGELREDIFLNSHSSLLLPPDWVNSFSPQLRPCIFQLVSMDSLPKICPFHGRNGESPQDPASAQHGMLFYRSMNAFISFNSSHISLLVLYLFSKWHRKTCMYYIPPSSALRDTFFITNFVLIFRLSARMRQRHLTTAFLIHFPQRKSFTWSMNTRLTSTIISSFFSPS